MYLIFTVACLIVFVFTNEPVAIICAALFSIANECQNINFTIRKLVVNKQEEIE